MSNCYGCKNKQNKRIIQIFGDKKQSYVTAGMMDWISYERYARLAMVSCTCCVWLRMGTEKCLFFVKDVMLDDVPVRLFLIKYGKKQDWIVLLTTDRTLSFVKVGRNAALMSRRIPPWIIVRRNLLIRRPYIRCIQNLVNLRTRSLRSGEEKINGGGVDSAW